MKAWASIFFFAVWPLKPASAEVLNLRYEELPALIRKNNSGVQAADSGTDAARLRVGSLTSSFLPSFEFESGIRGQKEANGSGEQAAYWKIDAVSNLYRGGRSAQRRDRLETEVSLRKLDAQTFFRQELMKVRADYIRLSGLRQMIQLNQNTKQESQSRKRALVVKIRAGLMAESFATELVLFDQELERGTLFLEKEMHEVEDRLVLALGLTPESTLKVKNLTAIDPGKQPAVERVGELPELRKLDLQAQVARQESIRHTEWWRPELDVFASYTGLQVKDRPLAGPLPEQETAVGLRLTLNLPGSVSLNQESAARMGEAKAFDLQKVYQSKLAASQVHEYLHEINSFGPILETLRHHLKTAESLQKKIAVEFERGIRDSSDVIESLRRVHAIQEQQLETLLNQQLAKAGLQTFLEGSMD